jgi:TonB family protein
MTATNFFNAATVTLTTLTLAAAVVTPVKAATPADFKAQVERSIETNMHLPSAHARTGVATVSVRIDANGKVESAAIVGSAGNTAFDQEAIRTAKAVSYPKGQARNVVMVLGFNRTVTASDRARSVSLAAKNDPRHLLASGTTAQPLG